MALHIFFALLWTILFLLCLWDKVTKSEHDFQGKDMPLIYMVALKYFPLYDLSSLTTLALYSVSSWLTTSTVLQSSRLNWADFIDSQVSTNSKHKSTPEKQDFIVRNFIIFAKYTAWLALDFLKMWWNAD